VIRTAHPATPRLALVACLAANLVVTAAPPAAYARAAARAGRTNRPAAANPMSPPGDVGQEQASTPTPAPHRAISVTGELVETGCFFMAGRRGPHHRACAMGCARAGQPIAIVDDSGVLRLAILDHRNERPENPLIEHLGRRVELAGTAVEAGGVNAILVEHVRPLSPPRDDD
jgi:hypothetical protein